VSARVVLSTAPNRRTARALAKRLVAERWAACVSILPAVESTYRWKGKIERSAECLLLVKTSSRRTPALIRRLDEIHPYDVPEIIALPVTRSSAPYLRWLEASVV
jgi:periplasmic divalent cation tolerance protein